jgi:phage terminase large subunit-like protein
MEAKRVKLIKGAWNDAFLLELAQFPNGAHDEYIDLLNMAIQDCQNSPPTMLI